MARTGTLASGGQPDASVILLAEVRLLPHEVTAAIAWCGRHGFTAFIEPALQSELGGML